MKALPRSKPPGIGIDIQGRDRDKYKIRITGARNKEQLNDIIDLMRVLIFLYSEIYLYKNKEYYTFHFFTLKLPEPSSKSIKSFGNKVLKKVNIGFVKAVVAIFMIIFITTPCRYLFITRIYPFVFCFSFQNQISILKFVSFEIFCHPNMASYFYCFKYIAIFISFIALFTTNETEYQNY